MSGLRERLMRLRGSSAQTGSLPGEGAADPQSREETGQYGLEEGGGAPVTANNGDQVHTQLPPEWNGLGVKAAHSPEGEFLLRVVRYPLTHRHGVHGLSELASAMEGLSAFNGVPAGRAAGRPGTKGVAAGSRQEAESEGTSSGGWRQTETNAATVIDPGTVLFFDLETTGLGIGAGNVPFMVGLAYSDGAESFVIEQMLIRHPAEERAMLSYLQSKLPAFTHLVTYNGRTFDWPVLQNRFILNGFRGFAWEPVHIDLLHPSRSVWRNTLASCKLSRVEEERLGILREGDIPGSEAPGIYFQYLADGNPEPLLGVFKHNETDMLSLACLAIRFGHLLAERLELAFPHPAEPEELLRTGLWLEKMGAAQAAEALFARVERDERSDAASLRTLAERDKKCGNWPRAVLLWQKVVQAAERVTRPGWEAHIELAMYYEHKTKQFDMALTLAETALELAQRRYSGIRLDAKRRAELDAIRKRIERLRLKTGRLSG